MTTHPLSWNGAWDDFWRFVRERHEMFRRRHHLHRPPPWTDDPHLRRGHFCNIYRNLDRGTRYLIVRILPSDPSPEVVLWRALVYRAFNAIATYEALNKAGFTDPATCDRAEALAVLRDREAQGHRIENPAYIISPSLTTAEARYRGESKIETVTRRLADLRLTLPQLYADLAHVGSMEAAHARLMQLRGMGPFTGYQMLVDLTYPEGILAFPDQDTWATFKPGRGTAQGLAELGVRSADGLDAMRQLMAEQPTDLLGPRLTLANITNCLCEYAKFSRVRRGGTAMREFTPATDTTLDAELWPPALALQYSQRRTAMP